MQQWRPENPAMTFDEVSMERSKSFVKALQELKNLRPQLYSAAGYCEKSYLHNEQKQILQQTLSINNIVPLKVMFSSQYLLKVLDNLKDYAVRALVNAVDHLGTVAYKLTDLFEQQTLDISTLELKISCLNQQILTCQTFTDKEGLRQQRMFPNNPRHHKHYTLPNSVSRQMQSSSQLQKDTNLNHVQPQPRPHPPGTPASKTLSWHLASETNSPSNGAPLAASSIGDIIAPKITSEAFHFLDTEDTAAPMPLSTHFRSASGTPTSNMALRSFGIRDSLEPSKSLTAFRSFDNPGRLQIYRSPVRSKSMLSAFFAKNKSLKSRKFSIG